jgi:hypothetical protein
LTKDKEKVKFSVQSYSIRLPEVKIKLNFINPKNISSGIEPDIIEAYITEDVNI